MSRPNETSTGAPPQIKGVKRKRTPEDDELLKSIDASIKRIRKHQPDEPYILTISTIEPRYHYPSAQEAFSWRLGTPFELHEEHLQYQSFVLRDDPGCFTQRSRLDLQRERDAANRKHINGPASGAGTPSVGGTAKRKISLEDYKNKKAGTGAQKADQNMPKKPDASKVHVNGVTGHERNNSGNASDASKGNKKMLDEIEQEVKSTFADDARNERSAKKPRPSLPSPHLPPKQPLPENAEPKRNLPPLLSPLKELPTKKLPELLSPTLPPEIEAELAKQDARPETTTQEKGEAGEKTRHVPSTKQDAAPSSKEEKASDQSPCSDPKPIPKVSADDLINEEAVRPKKFLVKLKYGRKRRKDVERILRLRPLPQKLEEVTKAKPSSNEVRSLPTSKQQPPPSTANTSSGAHKVKQQPESSVTTSTSTKCSRPDEESVDDQPSKRSKAAAPKQLDLSQHPQTPNNKAQLLSPSAIQKSGSKSNIHLTPLKAATMSRSSSLDGTTSTPNVATSTPPNVTGQELRPPTSAPNGDSQAEVKALYDAHRRLNMLGRKLKREHDDMVRRRGAGEVLSLAERRKGALKGLESVLCYILAFSCLDASAKLRRSRPRLENWKTIMPLHHSIANLTKEFSNLEGLRALMGVAATGRIGAILADGGSARPAPPPPPAAANPSTGTAPEQHESPESSHSSTTAAATAAPSTTDSSKEMIDNFTKLLHFLHEAAIKLNVSVIEQLSPITWSNKTDIPPRMSWERHISAIVHEGGEKDKDPELRKWHVGLDVATSPVQVGLLGLQMLGEVARGGDAAGYEVEAEGCLFGGK